MSSTFLPCYDDVSNVWAVWTAPGMQSGERAEGKGGRGPTQRRACPTRQLFPPAGPVECTDEPWNPGGDIVRRTQALGWALAATLVFATGLACNNEKKSSDTDSGKSESQEQAPRNGNAPRADF